MGMIIPNWPAAGNIKAISSTRIGGFSRGPYQGLNLGTHVGDDNHTVERNRGEIEYLANMPSAPVWLNQTHSTVVESLVQPTTTVLDADGAFTQSSGVVCCAMTADCLPVLLTNVLGTQVAAVHAGWRGLASGIIENAVIKFDGEVMAWIGPAIGQTVFEVGRDVVEAFTAIVPSAIEAFTQREQKGKWLADMNVLATQRLNRAGVHRIYYSNLCTYEDSNRFYSYRRNGTTGRQATFIWKEN